MLTCIGFVYLATFALSTLNINAVNIGVKKICKLLDETPPNTLLYENDTNDGCVMIDRGKVYFERNQDIKLTLVSVDNPFAKYFRIDPNNYTLLTGNTKIDRERICYDDEDSDTGRSECCQSRKRECLLPFMAKIVFMSQNTVTQTDYIDFYVLLIDLNDNSPKFKDSLLKIDLSEDAKSGDKIKLPSAIDQDSNEFSIRGYRLIHKQSKVHPFILNKYSRDKNMNYPSYLERELVEVDSPTDDIYLELTQPLDREIQQNYSFILQAEDRGVPPMIGNLDVFIKITDKNDNHPIFLNHSVQLTISENTGIGERVYQLKATDPDEGLGGMVNYQLLDSGDKRNTFIVDPNKGYIILNNRLDYETKKKYDLSVIAKDVLGDSGQDEAMLTIHVADENDEAPQIQLECNSDSRVRYLDKDSKDYTTFSWSVRESIASDIKTPMLIAFVSVSDRDSGQGGKVDCKLSSDNIDATNEATFSLQSIVEGKYELFLSSSIDYESQSLIKTKIICHDFGEPRKTSVKTIQILVEDINDNCPEFEKNNYYFTVKENDTYDMVVGKVYAFDKDSGDNGRITYSLDNSDSGENNAFAIRPNDGLIKVRQVLDREEKDYHQFLVYAIDQGSEIKMTATATVDVTVLDINDNDPKFIGVDDSDVFHFRVSEDVPIGHQIGVIMTNDYDGPGNNDVQYRMITSSVPFIINQQTGVVTTTEELDRERKVSYQFAVVAFDNGNPTGSSSAKVSIEILDVNDNDPIIVFPSQNDTTISISYKEPINEVIAKIEARDADEGINGQIHYSYFNHIPKYLFQIDEITGELRVVNEMHKEDIGKYSCEIHVQDSGIPARTTTVNLIVKVDDSIPRSTSWLSVKEKIKNNQAFLMKRGKFDRVDEENWITPGNILIVIVGLVCSVIIVLLGLTMYMCKKRGYLNQVNEIYKMELHDAEYTDQNPRTTPVLYTSLGEGKRFAYQTTNFSEDAPRNNYYPYPEAMHDNVDYSLRSFSTDQTSERSDNMSNKKKVYFSIVNNEKHPTNQHIDKVQGALSNEYTALVSMNNPDLGKREVSCDDLTSANKNLYYILCPNEKLSNDGNSVGKTNNNNTTSLPGKTTFNASTEGFV